MAKKLIKDSTLSAIADAIRDKGGASGPMTPQDMPAKIAAIPTEGGGSGGIDTSDATATPSDLAKDKTAYVNGEKVTGTIPETASGEVLLKTINKTTENATVIQHSHTLTEDALLRAGSIFRIGMTKASYGNATAADVLNGKTFTGADGFKKTGTLVPAGGGKQVKTGVLTVEGVNDTPYIHINDLPFKPEGCIAVWYCKDNTDNYMDDYATVAVATPEYTYVHAVSTMAGGSQVSDDSFVKSTFSDDGVTIESGIWMFPSQERMFYVVWGE